MNTDCGDTGEGKVKGDPGYWDSNHLMIILPVLSLLWPGEKITESHIPSSPLTTEAAPKLLDEYH